MSFAGATILVLLVVVWALLLTLGAALIAKRSLRIGDYEAFEQSAVDVAVHGDPGDDRETLPQRRDRLV